MLVQCNGQANIMAEFTITVEEICKNQKKLKYWQGTGPNDDICDVGKSDFVDVDRYINRTDFFDATFLGEEACDKAAVSGWYTPDYDSRKFRYWDNQQQQFTADINCDS